MISDDLLYPIIHQYTQLKWKEKDKKYEYKKE